MSTIEPIRACIDRRGSLPFHVDEMAAQKAAIWPHGQVLRIKFRGGRVRDRMSVMRAAETWMKFAKVKFVEVTTGKCEIRCSFLPGIGSWSYVGMDCLSAPPDEPTMNMGWPDDFGRDQHELGHSLGLIHEHQNPSAKIPWDREAVYAFYGGPPNFWTRPDIDQQVLAKYNGSLITNSVWDGKSIMEYPIPRQLVTDPSFVVAVNQSLSIIDRAFIARLYP